MKKIDLPELKLLQMEVLKAVHAFCGSEGIPYSMACGTMLGAVRHRGYIPWDDDIDIYMLRTDYNCFIERFPETLAGKYKLAGSYNIKGWKFPYSKVYDSTTLVKEPNSNPDVGVNIDVFPIDKVPEDEGKWRSFDHLRRLMFQCLMRRAHPFFSGYKALLKWPFYLLPYRVYLAAFERYIQQYNNSDSSCVFECCSGVFQKRPFKKSLFASMSPYPFETESFMGFSDFDSYLSNAFGNYMQLPPEEKRVSHHTFDAYYL